MKCIWKSVFYYPKLYPEIQRHCVNLVDSNQRWSTDEYSNSNWSCKIDAAETVLFGEAPEMIAFSPNDRWFHVTLANSVGYSLQIYLAIVVYMAEMCEWIPQ